MPLDVAPGVIGQEFDRSVYGPVTADELIAFAKAVGETRPVYTQPGPDLVAHPTYPVRFRGRRFYPDRLPAGIDMRTGFDAGKDLELGVPIRPGDTCTVSATLHEVYEKTGRSGTMVFVVIRFTITNQRGELVATVDNRFAHRGGS
jgi:acyl dehydratase